MPKTARSNYVAIPWDELPVWLSVQLPGFNRFAEHIGEPVHFESNFLVAQAPRTKTYEMTCVEEFPLFVGVKGELNKFFTKQLWGGYINSHGPTGITWWQHRTVEQTEGLFLGMWAVFANDVNVVHAHKNINRIVREHGREVFFDWVDVPIIIKIMTERGLVYFKQMVSCFWLSRVYEDHLLEGIENEPSFVSIRHSKETEKAFPWISWDFPVNSDT